MKFKLTSTQWIGLTVVVLFGTRLIFMLLEGPRDPDMLPSGVRLSDLPRVPEMQIDPFAPADPLAVGSQEAKDDLYCAGVVYLERVESADIATSDAGKNLNLYLRLGDAGRGKLIAENPGSGTGAYATASAWSQKARADKATGYAIPLDKCLARAEALPPLPAAPALPEPDYTAQGSQPAKDDLYCAGVISAEFDARDDQHPDEMSKQIAAMRTLDEAGLAKLRAEGVATENNGATYSLAFVAKAEADYAAKTLRIPFATCMERAAALKPAN
jgi:hypothetical protein